MSAALKDDVSRSELASRALRDLCSGLVDSAPILSSCEFVEAADLPGDYRHLLDHHDHMTTRLGDYFGRPVGVRVLSCRESADAYRRMILLELTGDARGVEFGLVWIDLHAIAEDVRREIVAGRRPLGDILIAHDVLRRIEPKWFVRLGPGSMVAGHLGAAEGEAVYGRIGVIHYEHKPAIRLLEVVRAERASEMDRGSPSRKSG